MKCSQILERRCAYWNANLSDFGAWDTEGCAIVEKTEMYTKCACGHFGIMVLLAEKIPPAVSKKDYLFFNSHARSKYLE